MLRVGFSAAPECASTLIAGIVLCSTIPRHQEHGHCNHLFTNILLYIYIHMITKFQIEHWDYNYNVIKCFGHETTFPHTHRYFRPATSTSIARKNPLVCGGQELN